MRISNLNKFVQDFIKRNIDFGSNDILIDATCGNGNDTFFLATNFPKNEIYAYDIQEQAIIHTKKRCEFFNNIHYINKSHETFTPEVKSCSLVMYNLGYLPHSDQQVTTNYQTTISSIESGLSILTRNGIMIITLYRGHDKSLEANEVEKHLKSIDKNKYLVNKYEMLNIELSPFVITIEKK